MEIPADVPLRRGKDIVSYDDLRDSFPVFLMMVEAIRDEVQQARELRLIEAAKKAAEEEKREKEEKEREEQQKAQQKLMQLKPGFVDGLPILIPGTQILQRGFNFVRQFSQSERSESNGSNLGRFSKLFLIFII